MNPYSLRKFNLSALSLTLLLISIPFSILISSAHANAVNNVVLLVDTSGSMNRKIAQAKEVMNTVIDDEKIQGEIAIVTFNSSSNVLLSPNTNKENAKNLVGSIKVGGNTALYDGLQTSLGIASNLNNAPIIAIVDGRDNSSLAKRSDISSLIENFPGEIYILNVGNDLVLKSDLNYLAENKANLVTIANINEFLETLKLPEPEPSKVPEPSVTKAPVQTSPLVVSEGDSAPDSREYQKWFFLLIASVLFLFAYFTYSYRTRSKKNERLQLLQAYDDAEVRNRMKEENSIFFRLMRIKVFNKYVKSEEKRLIASGLTLDVRSWIYIQIAVFIGANTMLSLVGTPFLINLIVAGFIGFGIGTFYLNSVRSKKALAFAEELPDTLTIIASSLKSGLNFTQAMEAVAKESDSEVATQFRRVLAEVQLGRLMTDALQDVADRMDSTDFRWTISALSIQRDVGGNLSDILTTTSETIRGRAEIRREVRSLSAEGRMSAYVLVALPFIMLLYLQLTKPDYLQIMFSRPVGILLMSVAAILVLVGWLWVKKVVEIKLT